MRTLLSLTICLFMLGLGVGITAPIYAEESPPSPTDDSTQPSPPNLLLGYEDEPAPPPEPAPTDEDKKDFTDSTSLLLTAEDEPAPEPPPAPTDDKGVISDALHLILAAEDEPPPDPPAPSGEENLTNGRFQLSLYEEEPAPQPTEPEEPAPEPTPAPELLESLS